MKKKTYTLPDDIARLVERFFDGDTSNAEERRLYDFFAREPLPDEWRPYRDMFAYFDGGLSDGLLPPAASAPREAAPARRLLGRRWRRVVQVAAVVAVVVWGGVAVTDRVATSRWEARHGGSYRIVNGHRIDDARSLRPYVEQSLEDARRLEREVAQSEAGQAQRMERLSRDLTDGVDDPELRRAIEEICQ